MICTGLEQTYVIACLASQPSIPAHTDGGIECWLDSWRTSHMSEAPCQPCKSFYCHASMAFGYPHFLWKSQIWFIIFSWEGNPISCLHMLHG